MKKLVVLALVGMLIGVLTMSCGKENVVGPTEYEYDTTFVVDTIIQYDTIFITDVVHDTIVGTYTAITAVHETFWHKYGFIVEFMPFSVIPAACAQEGWDVSPFGVAQIAPNKWHIVGLLYSWIDGLYYMHTNTATYVGGNPSAQSSWIITDPSGAPTRMPSTNSKR